MRSQLSVVALLLALFAIAVPVHAQTPSGEISGTVLDSSGLPVPGVTITLTNQATNVVRVVQTNEVGLYVISAIPPGTYDLKAELTGFRTRRAEGHRRPGGQREPARLHDGSGQPVGDARSRRRILR